MLIAVSVLAVKISPMTFKRISALTLSVSV